MRAPPTRTSKPFTHLADESAFTDTHYSIDTTTVHLIRPPTSHSSSRPWITARQTTTNDTVIFRHPLTSKRYSVLVSRNTDFKNLHPSTLPILVLYGGGMGCTHNPSSVKLSGSVQRTWRWVWLTLCGEKFDDIVKFEGRFYAVDREGVMKLIHDFKSDKKVKIGRTVVFQPVSPGSGRFGWRKRFAVDGGVLYLVVRIEYTRFRVYKLRMLGSKGFWEEVKRFGGDKVLFMARDYCFFLRASRKFPGREYRNCIVFSEAAFPQYGIDCWEFTSGVSENDIVIFRLDDGWCTWEVEGDNKIFPKIDWSPPDWILTASLFCAAEFKKHTVSESSESEPDEEERLDSDTVDKNGEEVQSLLKDSKSKDEEEEQEEMDSDFGCLDQDQRSVECDSASPDQEYEKMQCDLNSQEKEDVGMHLNENTAGVRHVPPSLFRPDSGATVTQTSLLSLSTTEKEITRTLLSLNDGNNATEEATLRKNITDLGHRACTSSIKASHKNDPATAKFEGFDIKLDSVSTLEKIWQKQGNIVENCAVRNSEILGKALESLVTVIRTLDEISPLSLSDSQADYLVSTMSDLRYIRLKVDWLIPFVEKAERIHKSKCSLESLNTLSQLSSKAQERRAILLDELTKLDMEEKTRKEKISKISKTIPFCGQVKFDKALGSGLT